MKNDAPAAAIAPALPPVISSGSKNKSSARHRAREFIIQGLYQHLIGAQDIPAITAQAATVPGFNKADTEFYHQFLTLAITHATTLSALLAPHLDRPWPEVSPVERAVLLLGACELQHHAAAPYRVVINEAIELAKSYGGIDGHKFINGILDKLAPQLRATELIA